MSMPIDAEMNPRFDMVCRYYGHCIDTQSNHAFMFTFRGSEGFPAMTWCLRFEAVPFATWKDEFTIHLWEGKNRMNYGKARADEQRYIQEAYDDVQMDEPEGEVEENGVDAEEGRDNERSIQAEQSDDEISSDSEGFAAGTKNEQLAVGYKSDLSFVARGNMIGVFAHNNDKIKFRTAIDRVNNLDGKNFSPRKVR